MARQKPDNQEFIVQVNSVFVVTARDGLDAHNKVVGAIAKTAPRRHRRPEN